MKRIWTLFKKDIILGIKDVFIILELGFSIFIVLLLLFVIPEDINQEGTVFIYDSTNVIENFIKKQIGEENLKEAGEFYVNSREELIEGMTENKMALGLIISENNNIYNVQLLTQPYTNESMVKYIEVDIEDLLNIITLPAGVYPLDVYNSVRLEALKVGLRDEIPFNKRILPPIFLMMIGILGLFAMVSLIGQERSEGTIRVFRAAPAGMWEFIISKHLILVAIGIVTFSIIYIPMLGLAGYLQSLLIIILTIVMGSSIGVILGGFFDNAMASILWVMLLLIVLALPAISLFYPVFSPMWLKFIPSYHTLFGLDAAIFPDNNSHIIWQSVVILAIIDFVLFNISGLIFNRLIRKEGYIV